MPHKIIAVAPSLDALRDEKEAHEYFLIFRRQGEFFEISHEQATQYLSQIMGKYQMEFQLNLKLVAGCAM